MIDENEAHNSSDDKVFKAWSVMDAMFTEMNFSVLEVITSLASSLGTTIAKTLTTKKQEEAIDEIMAEVRAMIVSIVAENELEKKKGLN